MFSTGSVWSKDEPDTSGPANVTTCIFERNTATDGGGMYSAAGYDIVRDCQFHANFAGEDAVEATTKIRSTPASYLSVHNYTMSMRSCLATFESGN